MENNKSDSEDGNISARITADEARQIAQDEYGLVVTNIKLVDGYDDLNFHILPPVWTSMLNFCIGPMHTLLAVTCSFNDAQLWKHGYILKVINWRESKNEPFYNEYINVLLHLSKENFPCPRPVQNKNGKYIGYWLDSKSNLPIECEKKIEPRKHVFLLLTFLQGEILEKFKYNQKVDVSLGHILNDLHIKLQPFRDTAAFFRPNFTWALHSAPNVVENLIHVITDKEKHSLVSKVISEFKNTVIPNLGSLERGVIHGDLNLGNVLVRKSALEEESFDIVGIIDFADLYNSYFIYDLALTACYISLHDVDIYEDKIALLLLGYKKQLSDLEMQLLKICICTRLCQSIVVGLNTLTIYPNNEYVKNSESLKYGWTLLSRLSDISGEEFIKTIKSKIQHFKRAFGSNVLETFVNHSQNNVQ